MQMQCGKRHALAVFNYGAFFMWGDNEFGQLGDRKRRYLESPMPKFKFELRHNVENVVCGLDSTAVVVEYIPEEQRPKKKKKKEKRVIKESEVITDRDMLEAVAKSNIKRKSDEEELDERIAKTASEKVKDSFWSAVYGKEEVEKSKRK